MKTTKKTKKFRFCGLLEAAEQLGVNRCHLYYVLKGARRSPRIERSDFYRRTMAAWAEFEKEQKKGHRNEETV